MNVPRPPLFTNNSEADLELLKTYVSDLYSALIAETPTGYTVAGAVDDRSLTVGDSLANTQHFVGTLIQDLITKGIIQ